MNGYSVVNSENNIFKKTKGTNYIIHGLFVDDMMHISSSNELKQEFMAKYSMDFQITGGGLMKTFLGMEVEQSRKTIKLHLDCNIQQVLADYKEYIKKVPISPGVILNPADVPVLLDLRKQKYNQSFVAKLRFAATWVRIDIAYTTSGMLMLYNKSPILWKSKMQKTTALSTAEAEYYSASTSAVEILYLRYVAIMCFRS
jgi:hypothetical protein